MLAAIGIFCQVCLVGFEARRRLYSAPKTTSPSKSTLLVGRPECPSCCFGWMRVLRSGSQQMWGKKLIMRSLVMIWFIMYLYHFCYILVCGWLFGISFLILIRMGQLGGESAIDNLQLPNLLRRRDALLLMVGYRTLKWQQDVLRCVCSDSHSLTWFAERALS